MKLQAFKQMDLKQYRYEQPLKLLALIYLLLVLVGICFDPQVALADFGGNRHSLPVTQPHLTEVADDNIPAFYPLPALSDAHTLLARVPHVNHARYLSLPNFREDMAMREALLATPAQWQQASASGLSCYHASNALHVYYQAGEDPSQVCSMPGQSKITGDSTLLTARILLGLWNNRHTDPQLSAHGLVAIKVEEILAWRGIQKHQRIAYPGASKRFSDGYQSKQKQQIHAELLHLSRYTLRGQQYIRQQGQVHVNALNTPYMHVQQVAQGHKITGYLVGPGNWIASYQSGNSMFLSSVERQIFQLHPRNDYLALRLAFYLVEHWRQLARSGDYQHPLQMAQLLSASMISVDKANLTSRFVPRIEAALHKLYAQNILGQPAICLSQLDTNKAHWGNEWLASYWRLLPPDDIMHAYTSRKALPAYL
ncbi:hypothetical protein KDW_46810 [Dictyobacter vulcani]|uniref:Uncharacterized protein n=1 Tax=Dictyobacter vulcani TaxID=2607529 RepID=A0A5J4KWL2_9CHLR|nr:hypothetical protein [Dictyobacter vulcani]GER90519.1 hypothetical protein KDW_46810 [Dictyobacter vulcani]